VAGRREGGRSLLNQRLSSIRRRCWGRRKKFSIFFGCHIFEVPGAELSQGEGEGRRGEELLVIFFETIKETGDLLGWSEEKGREGESRSVNLIGILFKEVI
jgi:hypothetical protein